MSNAADTDAPKTHLDFLDGLRALAALFVVACHAYFEPANGFHNSRILTHLGFSYGHLAVDVFIVLSGYCLMLPIARRAGTPVDWKIFYTRRVRRILPPYYAVLILSIAYIALLANQKTGTVWDNSIPLTWQTIVSHLLLIHDLPTGLAGGTINYPLWSIAVEFRLYLTMPLLLLSLARFGAKVTLAWTVTAGILFHFAFGAFDSAMPWYLGLFTMGLLAARQSVSGKRAPLSPRLCAGLWLLVGAILAVKGNAWFTKNTFAIDTAVGAATACLLILTYADASSRSRLVTRLLSWPPLVTVGVFSYSVYLVHAPLLHVFDRLFTRLFHPGIDLMFGLLLLTIPAIVALAYVFHLAFEKPFMRPTRRLSHTRPDDGSPASAVVAG